MVVKVGKHSGFTLLELMIVVAVIAVLAAIAIPNYAEYVKRTNRADVQTYMMSIAQNVESYRLVNHSFFGVSLGVLGGDKFPQISDQKYQLTLTDLSGKEFSDESANLQSWLLVARPTSGSTQVGTGAIVLDSNGNKCWYKNNDTANVVATMNNGAVIPAATCDYKWEDR